MARRSLSATEGLRASTCSKTVGKACCSGYVLANAGYDVSHLRDLVLSHDGKLVSPRRALNRCKRLGHCRHSHRPKHRHVHTIAMLQDTVSMFGSDRYILLTVIERKFGYLTSTPGLLTHLPSWARTLSEKMWVQTKILLADIRTNL